MNQGFTLDESLVAIFILVLAVTGAFSAATSGINSAIHSKNQIVAFYLAQEAIEQIRNMRDENGLNGRSWLYGIAEPGSPCAFGNICRVDTVANTLTTCSGACPQLRQSTSNGFFGYNAGYEATVFRRDVSLARINDNEISILVTVEWSKGLVQREFRARENIFNWQ
jgi:type II secretory pathway pseudopilin PulG